MPTAASVPRGAPRAAAPRRRTQQERRSEAATRLLDAARDIIAEKGSVGMTLAEVGLAAGYSRGLATHHFGTKAALLRALATRINVEFMSEVAAANPARTEGLDAVIGFVETYLDRRDKRWTNTRALLVLMAEAATVESEVSEGLAQFNRSVVEMLEQQFRAGVANGDMRPEIDPAACAVILIGAMRGVMMQRLLKNSAVDVAAISHQLVSMLVFSVARQPRKWKVNAP